MHKYSLVVETACVLNINLETLTGYETVATVLQVSIN